MRCVTVLCVIAMLTGCEPRTPMRVVADDGVHRWVITCNDSPQRLTWCTASLLSDQPIITVE